MMRTRQWTWFLPLLGLLAPVGVLAAKAPVGEPAIALHITNGGLAQLGDAVEAMVPASIVLEDGSGEYACSEDEGDALTYSLSGLELLLSADEVALYATKGAINLDLYGTLNSTEGSLSVSGDCSFFEGLADVCAVQLPTTAFEAAMTISLSAVDGGIEASVAGPTLTISPIGNPLSGDDCNLDSAVGTLIGQNPMAITDMMLDALGGSLEDIGAELAGSLEDALGGLAIDTALAFGESEVGLVLEPSLVQASAEGLVIGFTSVVVPGETADCVDLAYETEISTADWPMFSETADGSTLAYDIGFFIGRSFVDEVLQEIWAAGGLCMEVADLSGVPLGTSLMSGFVGDEFAALFPDNEASVLSIVPTAPPTIGFEDDGAPLRLLLDNLGMVYYAGLDHRMAGIFEVGITVEAGLDISLTSEELATALVLDPTAMDFEERWSELLGPGYSDGLADNLPSLVEAILPEDLLPTMAMPSILGIEIDTVIWQPTTDGEWQAGYLMLDTSKVEAIEISGCGIDALGCGGESSGVEFDLGEALGCSSDDALGCDEASSDCSSGCSASGRLSIPFARFGLLGLLGLGVLRRRRK